MYCAGASWYDALGIVLRVCGMGLGIVPCGVVCCCLLCRGCVYCVGVGGGVLLVSWCGVVWCRMGPCCRM